MEPLKEFFDKYPFINMDILRRLYKYLAEEDRWPTVREAIKLLIEDKPKEAISVISKELEDELEDDFARLLYAQIVFTAYIVPIILYLDRNMKELEREATRVLFDNDMLLIMALKLKKVKEKYRPLIERLISISIQTVLRLVQFSVAGVQIELYYDRRTISALLDTLLDRLKELSSLVKNPEYESLILYFLGIKNLLAGEYYQAFISLEKAFDIGVRYKLPESHIFRYANALCVSLAFLRDYKTAISIIDSLDFETPELSYHKAIIRAKMGEIFEALEDLDQLERKLKKGISSVSETTRKKLEDILSLIYIAKSRIHRKLGNKDLAKNYEDKSELPPLPFMIIYRAYDGVPIINAQKFLI